MKKYKVSFYKEHKFLDSFEVTANGQGKAEMTARKRYESKYDTKSDNLIVEIRQIKEDDLV